MKIQKRVVALGLTGLMMASLAPEASAMGAMDKPAVKSNVEIVREDVSREEAMCDPTFNLALSQMLLENNQETRGARWEVWGDTERATPTTTYPVGYSQHVNSDGDVLVHIITPELILLMALRRLVILDAFGEMEKFEPPVVHV